MVIDQASKGEIQNYVTILLLENGLSKVAGLQDKIIDLVYYFRKSDCEEILSLESKLKHSQPSEKYNDLVVKHNNQLAMKNAAIAKVEELEVLIAEMIDANSEYRENTVSLTRYTALLELAKDLDSEIEKNLKDIMNVELEAQDHVM